MMTGNAVKWVEVAVVGAGAVGLAAALAFARDGRRCALVGPAGAPRNGRTVALLDGSVRFLDSLSVGEIVPQHGAPLRVMRIVDDTGSLFRAPPLAFEAREIGLDAFGWNVENADLVTGLLEAVRAEAHIVHHEAMATVIALSSEDTWLTLADGTRIGADLVVAADGKKSPVRAAAGIPSKEWSYGQSALTVLLDHDLPHGDVSTEFHTREGPFTLVPLAGNRSSLVWLMSPGAARRLAALDDDTLAATIERRAQSMLGGMRLAGPRGLVPMTGLSVERYTGKRTALVGEAAHAFPPIGAQGLNLGFRDVASLAQAAKNEADPGDDRVLRAYQASRLRDVPVRAGAVNTLNRSLVTDVLAVDFLRGAGLVALHAVGPLRRALMRQGLAKAALERA